MSTPTPLRAASLEELRQRSSTKWRSYPDDVIPLFVAETDYPLAPAITAALRRAVELGDTGYTPPDPGLKAGFTAFAARRFGWSVDPAGIRSTCDVMMGVVELLRTGIAPGDRVVITPPVYPPFFDCVPEAGGVALQVPLLDTGDGWELDLHGIDRAFASGARGILISNPHNPTGTTHTRETLTALAESAERHGAFVLSDEIHGPLALPGETYTPFLSVSQAAERVGFAVTSASKAFNLAGLKCALMVGASPERIATIRGLPAEVEWRTGLFGALASVAAFAEESDEWLDAEIAAIAESHRLLAELLATHVPEARYRVPQAGYLAWVDLRAYDWGDDPAVTLRRRARVAPHHGPFFGAEGRGFARFNVACAPDVLTEAIERVGALARA